ncbi:type II secretion system protein GspI [Aquabacterium soli]|jgi:general secretion pathway protein I|uniref:Type II secretion system protein I n=1 Tax=Aquabacterium soli TaxID=2493092 RepID=A0A3R8T832_9BURK|nr:type II secretion system minor pseudopilin GspI [Aquabacterium soli]RRS06201.1 type II secretion system protein GspI [Aquabacterium soli]
MRAEVHARPRGMTLIEVLVALSVVAITLAAGFKAAGGLTVNAQRLADLTVAQWCAENQLTNLRLARVYPDPGEGEFQCQQLGRQLKGLQRVKTTPNPNFRRVDTQVLDEQGQSVVSISTVVSRYPD